MSSKIKRLPSHNFIVQSFGYLSPEGLKKRNYPIDIKDNNGWTPLHEAAWWGRVEMVRYLLSKGADPLTQNKYGRTPLDVAENRGHDHVAEILRESTNSQNREGN